MNYLSHNISINLKRIRQSKGLSLDTVSEQTGVSKSMLATIESGQANPSIGVLGKIISGLRIDFNDLIDTPPKDAYLVHVPSTAPTKNVPGQYKVWTCFPIEDNHQVEIYRIDIEPNGTYVSGSHGERTREYISVLDGELSLEIQNGTHTISKDDVFRFESDQEHIYRNLTEKSVHIITLFVCY